MRLLKSADLPLNNELPEFTAFLRGYGHPNIRATHTSTVEFTTQRHLTSKGDCIVVVAADIGAAGLPQPLKNSLRNPGSTAVFELTCEGERDTLTARGHSLLTLDDPVSMVVRKSRYTSPRTVAVDSDKAARDLSRTLVRKLASGAEATVRITVSTP
ncbi:MAG: DUF371 domain-containing protein [Candidatus Marsarchaeota archaeon]|nr:DUF371 domain-containing protein [Candidatus Marsarchaeota archaeon]